MIVSSEEFCMIRDALEAHALSTTLSCVFARIVPILAVLRLTSAGLVLKSPAWNQKVTGV